MMSLLRNFTLLALMVTSLVFGAALAAPERPVGGILTKTSAAYMVTVELDQALIIEDRDIGAGEIYIKWRVNGGSDQFTRIYDNINDGALIQLDLIMISNQELSAYSCRVEVWESDNGYDESQNDFLGFVSITRDTPMSAQGWHDCLGPIGGNNVVQARLLIIETASEPPTIDHPADVTYVSGTSGHSLTWNAQCPTPSHYTVERDDVVLFGNPWDGTQIVVNIDGLAVGHYVYECTVWSTNGQSASDSVVVFVQESTSVTESTSTVTTTSSNPTRPQLGFSTPALLTIVALLGFSAIVIKRRIS